METVTRTELKFVYGLQSDEFGFSATTVVQTLLAKPVWRSCDAKQKYTTKTNLLHVVNMAWKNNTLLEEEQIIKQKFRNF